ncbi:trichohyalin-like, partial [Trifolium medium]|nr:trichohyalin-like [Trifolium medium]
NAGFDPAVIRVDGYGNVLYYHADSASPLAWDIDHWFPCSSIFLSLSF